MNETVNTSTFLPNNRIHSNKQGRAAVTFAQFEENVAFTTARFPACR